MIWERVGGSAGEVWDVILMYVVRLENSSPNNEI